MKYEQKINMSFVAHKIVEHIKHVYSCNDDISFDEDSINESLVNYEEFWSLSEEYQKIVILELLAFSQLLQTSEMVRCYGQCENVFASTAKFPKMKRFNVKKESMISKVIIDSIKKKREAAVCL